MRVLILGSTGQDGHYLAEVCRARGDTVLGVSRSTRPLACDVSVAEQVDAVLADFAPDRIYLLAARSSTREGLFGEHQHTIVDGCSHVLAATERRCPNARVFVAGSALQLENRGAPIDESAGFRADSSYALARVQAAWIARHFRGRGLAVCIGYLFHHESPLRPVAHVAQHVATTARRIAAGSRERLTLGAPDVRREWTFAGDTARAMMTALEQDAEPELVIGSGQAHSIAEWAQHCFAACDLDWRDHTDVDAGYVPEYRLLVSAPRRLERLGWRPTKTMAELAREMTAGTEAPVPA